MSIGAHNSRLLLRKKDVWHTIGANHATHASRMPAKGGMPNESNTMHTACKGMPICATKFFFHPDYNCRYRSCNGSCPASRLCAPRRRLADYTADREFHPALKSLLGAKLQQITGIGKPRQQKPRGVMRLRAWGIKIMSIYSSVTPPAPAPQ